MTDLRRWSILNKKAFRGEKFVDVELVKERLGDEYDEYIKLNHSFFGHRNIFFRK